VTITNGGIVNIAAPGGNFAGYGSVTPAITFVVGPNSLLEETSGNDTMGPIILNGGTLLSASTAGAQYDTFELSSITSGGTNGSLITSGNLTAPGGGVNLTINGGAGAQLTFTVAPTGSGGPDLTVASMLLNAGGSQSATGFILTGGGVMAVNNANIFSGPVTLTSGTVQLNGIETPGTSGPLGTGGTITFGGGTLQYSATNQNDYSARYSTAASQQYRIDTAGQTVTNATALSSSSGVLTKLGLGSLYLTVANTFAGGTTVSNGTLALTSTGSISNTSGISISPGGTLDVSSQASFAVASGVRLTASGTTNPAVMAAQALAVNGPITLVYNGSQPALVISKGTLTLNKNAFTVNAASPLGAGTYTLISQQSGNVVSNGAYTVTGTAVVAPNTASIAVNGGLVQLIVVAPSVPTIGTNLVFSVSSGSLKFSWPTAYLGSALQSNSINIQVNTNWYTIAGSTTVTNLTLPIGSNGSVFFRLNTP
jgi:autotransporter-associated beta strand protein